MTPAPAPAPDSSPPDRSKPTDETAHTGPALVRDGSSLYYSLLWTEPEARERFIRRLKLLQAIGSTLDDVQEAQVAERKVHWWHEEIERLHQGCARHPALQANQKELAGIEQAQQTCLALLSATATRRLSPVSNEAEAEQRLIEEFRARAALLSHALSGKTNDLEPSTHPAAAAIAAGQHEQLLRLPAWLHRGMPVFSNELYQRFNTSPENLAQGIKKAAPDQNAPETPSIKGIAITSTPARAEYQATAAVQKQQEKTRQALINYLIERCKQGLEDAAQDQDVQARYRHSPLLPLWRMLVLKRLQSQLWHKKQPDLLRERVTPTPLIKLWVAWRHRG